MARRQLIPRTRASNTMTEAQYWSFIRSALRNKSMFWKPIYDAKLDARRNNQGPNKRLRYEYQCAICKNWFAEKEIEVDHIQQVGTLKNGDDLKGFVERLFCEKEGLRILCEPCHKSVTKQQADAKTRI